MFSALGSIRTGAQFELFEGYPSELNSMLREGSLDISPSSSIEYLRDKESYRILKGHSISSRGPIRSILLFSRLPIENLCEDEVHCTHQSETSITLLKVILNMFYNTDCMLTVTETPFMEAILKHSSYLSIGDDALRAFEGAKKLDIAPPEDCLVICSLEHQAFYVYDLGDLWYRHTSRPSVFALWTYRADLPEEKMDMIRAFESDLTRATQYAMDNLDAIADTLGTGMPKARAIEYWKGIVYGLPEDCMEGLSLFEKYLIETGQLGGD